MFRVFRGFSLGRHCRCCAVCRADGGERAQQPDRAVPSLAAYSSVGEEVVVRIGKNAVQIGKDGKTTLTPSELKQLTGK